MKPKKSRKVIARKEHTCKDCRKKIAKEDVCVQSGRAFYHEDCYARLRLLLGKIYLEPKITSPVSKKKIVEWYIEKEGLK